MGISSSFDSKAWTGASGNGIGFAGDYPVTQPWGFVTDSIHGQTVDPNGPNQAAQQGPPSQVSGADIMSGEEFLYQGENTPGVYGWDLDDIMFPMVGTDPGTYGHDSEMGPAQNRGNHGPDVAHQYDVYQRQEPIGYGRVFYGDNPLKRDLDAWANSNTPAPNTKQYPAQAREETADWPTPFKAVEVAPWRPVDESTERIPMRRMQEDDRPIYRYIAVAPMNIQPTGNQWGPQYPSNVPVQNVTPVPMMPQTPVDPWITQEQATANVSESPDVFGGMALQ